MVVSAIVLFCFLLLNEIWLTFHAESSGIYKLYNRVGLNLSLDFLAPSIVSDEESESHSSHDQVQLKLRYHMGGA